MPTDYKVKVKDNLPDIGKEQLFSVESLIKENVDKWPDLYKNPEVLMDGMTILIPDRKAGEQSQSTGTIAKYQVAVPPKHYLRLSIKDPWGALVPEKTKLFIGSAGAADAGGVEIKKVLYNDSDPSKRMLVIQTVKELPQPISSIASASLELTLYSTSGIKKKVKETIKLHIGELSPILDPNDYKSEKEKHSPKAIMAVQKILTNLGYYVTKKKQGDREVVVNQIDGIYNSATEAAITSFQMDIKRDYEETGDADNDTLNVLIDKIGLRMMGPQLLKEKKTRKYLVFKDNTSKSAEDNKNRPLFKHMGAKMTALSSGKVEPFDKYDEPTRHVSAKTPKPGPEASREITRYPLEAFVAPHLGKKDVDSGPRSNVISCCLPKVVCMDAGAWYKDSLNFGVIWGRHVYLCSYDKKSYHASAKEPPKVELSFNRGVDAHLDYRFFKNIKNVSIINWSYCYWGGESEYDWTKMYIVIPDMHLMCQKIGDHWYDKKFNVNAGLALLDFGLQVENITPKFAKTDIEFVQAGDAYDLWVGSGFATQSIKDEFNRQHQKWVSEYGTGIHPTKVLGALASIPSQDFTEEPRRTGYMMDPLFKNSSEGVIEYVNGPMFKFIEGNATEFEEVIDIKREIRNMVKEIQGVGLYDWVKEIPGIEAILNKLTTNDRVWREQSRILNPAEAAFRLFKEKFTITFIYGNHDNYLIDDEITREIPELEPRKKWFENAKETIYMEHSHRMEQLFLNEKYYTSSKYKGENAIPRNNDGETSGFLATNAYYLINKRGMQLPPTYASRFGKITMAVGGYFADTYAKIHDRDIYFEEFRRIIVGRLSTGAKGVPQVMIIAHTLKKKARDEAPEVGEMRMMRV
ncbi:MAG: peptidoglycan-binding domain-containing protein [Bacteroidetes bacterium]|nr:peptidoglycan-binding domain-containing protein [Bacteroidota bacterium]